MNPFTQSTVARPLSEPPARAANDNNPPDNDIPQNSARPAVAPVSNDVEPGRKPARYPRSGRLVRRRGRAPVSRRLAWAVARWPACYRKAAGAVVGLAMALALPTAWAVNVNSASAQQLESITGIGPKTAQIIIDERTRGGSFESFDDLAERVKGIGPKKARALQAAGLTVGESRSAEAKPTAAPPRKAGR